MPSNDRDSEKSQSAAWRLRPFVFNWGFGTGLIIVGLIFATTIFQIRMDRQRNQTNIAAQAINLSLIFEQSISFSFGEIDNALKIMRATYAGANGALSWNTLIRHNYVANGLSVQISAIDDDGFLIASSIPSSATSKVYLGDREHFKVHANSNQDNLYISRPVIGRISGKPTIQLSRRFLERDGSFGGVLVISLDPELLTQNFNDLDLGPHGGVALIGDDDVYRAGTKAFKSMIGRAYREVSVMGEYTVQPFVGRQFAGTVESHRIAGVENLTATRSIDKLPLRVTVSIGNAFSTGILTEGEETYIAIATLCAIIVIASALARVRSQLLAAHVLEQRNALEFQKKLAENAAADRGLFLAVMSHEIRTPLNGVLGALDLVRECQLDERGRRFTNIATQSGEALLNLIDDILLFAKDENGKIELAEQGFVLETLVEGVRDTMEPMTKGSRNTIEVSICPEAGQTVIGDSGRLRQVLVNLMNNANKFTSSGLLTLRVERVSCSEKKLLVRISVLDTGIGIPKDKQKLIFNRFETLDASYSRRTDGTGLGLAICDKLVRAMGGNIAVDSEVGKGSCFSFDLEFVLANEKIKGHTEIPISASVTKDCAPLRILLAEDNPTNAFVALQFLSEAGHEVHHVVNGREAVGAACVRPFDLILMDISMPEMDGIEATAAIRSSGPLNAATKIIALTAHAVGGDQDKFLGAQMDGYLTKPIRRAVLLNALKSYGAPNPVAVELQQDRSESLIDMTTFAEFVSERSVDRLHRTLEIFRTELIQKTQSLTEIIAARDTKELQMLAHSTLGSGAMVGAARLVGQSRAIELSCIRNETIDWAQAKGLLVAMKETVEAFNEFRSKESIASVREKKALAA